MHDSTTDIDKIIEENLGLVAYVIRRRFRKYVANQDIWQEGRIGLWKAAQRFDPSLGHKFSSFAYVVIWRRICNYIKTAKLQEVYEEFSLDSEAFILEGDGQADTLFGSDLISDHGNSEAAIEAVCSEVVTEGIIEKIRQKNPRTADIITLRMNGKTLDEIGNKYGLTRERIRQICRGAAKYLPKEY